MNDNNLLYIPLKQSTPINLGEKLSSIIDDRYFQPSSLFKTDLSQLTKIRNQVTDIKLPSLNQLDQLFNYLSILSDVLEKKFSDDSIEFSWSDLLSYHLKNNKLKSFKFEKLNVIFQIGSMYSQLALQESRHTDDGLKKSCNYFQLAAGCFQYISNLVSKYHTVHFSSDFKDETILCLMNLMLAQAQETIWQKALNNATIKNSVVARLSLSVSEYYSKSIEFGKQSDFIKLEWLNHMNVKKYHFLAASHFRASNIALEANDYGVQVAHLRLAARYVDQAHKFKKYVNKFVLDDLSGLDDAIKTRLRTAEKDNDLIYLKLVPNEGDLKKIEGASMVKPLYSDKFDEESNTYLKDLVPYIIINVAQALRERQDDFINSRFQEPIESLNKMLKKFINERGLPASIDSLQQPENIPDSIIHHSKELMNLGGEKTIEHQMSENKKLSDECKNLVEECNKRINLDLSEDNMLRERQGTARWNRPTTSEAAKELVFKIDKMHEYLNQAKIGDDVVGQKYHNVKPALKILTGGQQALNSFIPNSSYTKLQPALVQKINSLRDLLSEITTLESDRRSFLNSLEIKSRDNNILPKLIDIYKANPNKFTTDSNDLGVYEEVYKQHLQIFNSDFDYVAKSKQQQIELEKNIDVANNSFVKLLQSTEDTATSERQQALQTLENAYNQYSEIKSNLTEGFKFYHDFLTKGSNVLKDCEEYLYKRRVESRDLEISLNAPATQSQGSEQPLVSPKSTKPAGGIWNSNAEIKFG